MDLANDIFKIVGFSTILGGGFSDESKCLSCLVQPAKPVKATRCQSCAVHQSCTGGGGGGVAAALALAPTCALLAHWIYNPKEDLSAASAGGDPAI